MSAMARIEVTTEAGRTTIIVRRSAKEWIGFMPRILGLLGTCLIAAFAGFFFFRFRIGSGESPFGPWIALFTCIVATFAFCMQSSQYASYLGSRSILSIERLNLTVRRTRSFLFDDVVTCACPALFGLRWAFPEAGRPLGSGSSGVRIVGPHFGLLWRDREPLGEVLADVDGKQIVLASALTQGDGLRLIDEMCAVYPFKILETSAV
jgi:hypothetical protein